MFVLADQESGGLLRAASLMLMTLAMCMGLLFNGGAHAAQGKVLCPVISGSYEKLPFEGHPGWVDVYARGDSTGRPARIGADARFDLGRVSDPVALIASFDHLETLPIIVPRWPTGVGDYNVSLWGDYICVPPGYPEVWEREYMTRARTYFQTFIAHSSHLYGVTAFDGPKIVHWGNKVHSFLSERRPGGEPIVFPAHDGGGRTEMNTAHHSDFEFPYMGWRHGDVSFTPGRQYTMRLTGYQSHGGQRFELDSFVRPKNGGGYPFGRAYLENPSNPLDGDLCLIIQGNSNGQIVENQIRSEEWNVLLPKRKPVTSWGQEFVPNGVSMAGLVIWASLGSADSASCETRIREGGPGGKIIGPTKTAVGHKISHGPYIRYPDCPGPLEGYSEYYRMASGNDLEPGYLQNPYVFQLAYVPDEVPLELDKTYYIDLNFNRPVLLYVDGDHYPHGYAYYDGDRVESEPFLQHGDKRWALAATIVTYENPGGAANRLNP